MNASNNSITAVSSSTNSIIGLEEPCHSKISTNFETPVLENSSTKLSDSTSDLVKKNFFDSLPKSGADKDDTPRIIIQNKTLQEIKTELIRLFLAIQELSHSVVGQNSFRLEYKKLTYVRSSQTVKFQGFKFEIIFIYEVNYFS
ncbi:unnamed protein product [Meloidogyne enterolobii]|uniref:Uncharacterized protein n=1 Tax=Meloidogyne enterolobii TaxID=390850 RepID=A0ACB0ZI35_MELEN